MDAGGRASAVKFEQTGEGNELRYVLTKRKAVELEEGQMPGSKELLWICLEILSKRCRVLERTLSEQMLFSHQLRIEAPRTFEDGATSSTASPGVPFSPAHKGSIVRASQTACTKVVGVPPSGRVLSELVRNKLADYKIVLRHDIADRNGNRFVPGGNNSASLCGAFPHSLTASKPGEENPERYWVSQDRRVVLHLELRHKKRPNDKSVTEQTILAEIRKSVAAEELATLGFYEKNLVFSVQLCFFDGGTVGKYIKSDDDEQGGSCFSISPPHQKCFLPNELPEYSNGPTEACFENGVAEFAFSLNRSVHTSNLTQQFKNRPFQFQIKCLNPFLQTIDGLEVVKSMPFFTNASSGKKLSKDEWYKVDSADNTKQKIVPRSDILVRAAVPRKA